MEVIAGSRDIPLASVLNVRDVGGIKTSTGQTVKTGRLIRGGRPDGISSADLDLLVNDAGVTTFLDLRSPDQFERAGDSEIVRRGVNRVNVPLSDRAPTGASEVDFLMGLLETGTMGDQRGGYLRFINSTDRFATAMETITVPNSGAVFVHCTAGKDRTGVVVAIALSAVGVHRDDIVADYAESSRVTAAFIESFFGASERFQKIRETLDPALLGSYLDALPEVMHDVLAEVDDEYGSPRKYLLDLPGGVQVLEYLERKLLG